MASYPRHRGGDRWELRAYAGREADKPVFLYGTFRGGARGAKAAQAELVRRAAAQRGKPVAKRAAIKTATERTFADAAEAWFTWKLDQMEPNGRDHVRTVLDFYLLPKIGDVALWRFRPELALEEGDDPDPLLFDLTAFFAGLVERGGRHGGPLAPSTVTQGPARVAQAVFAHAVRRGWLAVNPATGVRRPHVPRRPPTVPEPAALFRFFAFLADYDPELYTWLELMNSGARRVDLAVKWREWDPAKAAITLGARGIILRRDEVAATGKMRAEVRETPTSKRRLRTIALDDSANAALRAHRVRMGELALAAGLGGVRPDGFIFATDAAGEVPRRPDWATHAFKEAKKAAVDAGIRGIESMRMYDCRHFQITQLYNAGVPAAVLAERSGNSVGTIERYYRHAAPARDREAADLMAKLRQEATARPAANRKAGRK